MFILEIDPGANSGNKKTAIANKKQTIPTARENIFFLVVCFSTAITIVKTSMVAIFITPKININTIKKKQQPKQKTP